MAIKSSLALRLAVWFLLLSIFPLAVVGIFVLDDVKAGFTKLTLDHRRSQTELLAATLGRIPLNDIATILPRNATGQNSIIFIVQPGGQYRFHPDGTKIGAALHEDFSSDVVRSILSGETGAVLETGTDRVIGFSPISGQQSILVNVADRSTAAAVMSTIRRTSQIQLAVSLLIMAIAGGIAIWIVVGSPLRRLTRAAEQVSRGDLNITVDPEDTVDELQMLARAFNQMTDQLRNLISGLELKVLELSLIHISEPTRRNQSSRMPSSA